MIFYRAITPLQAISFDLDDTLYANHPVMEKLEQGMLQWLHQNHSISQSTDHLYWRFIKQQVAQKNPELRDNVTLWRQIQLEYGLSQLGYTPKKAKSVALIAVEYALELRNQIDIPKQTHQVLAELAQRMPLVAITNGNVDVNKIGLNHYFQTVLKAGVDGRAKPNADLFHCAIERLNHSSFNQAFKTSIKPQQVLHVGDHLLTDVFGAKQAGLSAAWFNDQRQPILSHNQAKILPDIEINTLNALVHII